MSNSSKLEELFQLVEGASSTLGFTLVDLRLLPQGRRQCLEVTICKPGGRVGLDDCESVSRKLETILDEEQPPVLEGAYTLDVQSPGIDRILKSDREYKIFQGIMVEVKSKENLAGLGYSFRGTLVGRSADTVTISNPRPLLSSKRQIAGSKSNAESVAGIEEIRLDATRVVHVRLYPENLPADETDTASLL